ncbi:MAG: SIR2 family protein [Candidatus Komeilibacteria bacterium]|nr:SIR2 family protein [Candidatus Komeilibacteria bacterium]
MNIQEIKEAVQSSHINFLFGAGLSTPFLPLLGDIETRLSIETRKPERIKIKKEYFEKIMMPNLDVISGNIEAIKQAEFNSTCKAYKNFFELISHILLKRKNTILSKQTNIFTTNIDILMEVVLEESGLEYNDGFTGRLNSVFSLSNFKKSILKRSLHFENISEIPIFNLMKIHGSLTWEKIKDNIYFSKLKHFDKTILNKSGKNFDERYGKIAIINPEKKKFEETVIDLTYYELLRMYSSELEKENVVLFVMGFSMEDEHIREITLRTANSNPTLKIYIFCHEQDKDSKMKEKMHIGKLRYSNIEIIEPTDDEQRNKFSLEKINELVFKEISNSATHECKDDCKN